MNKLISLALLFGLSACDKDPARSVKIISRPPAGIKAAPAIETGEKRKPPAGCPPEPEALLKGPSVLTVAGPCAFDHHGAVNCEILPDDLIMTVTRKGANGATVMVYVNVERYHGPGRYNDSQMFVGVQNTSQIERWSNDNVSLTVGPDRKYIDLESTSLPAEPRLSDCTGPMTNFQCAGRGTAASVIDAAPVTVSGRLVCDDHAER